MVRQRVKGRSVSPVVGVLIILGIAASIMIVSWIEQAIRLTTGFRIGAAVVWLAVVAEAVGVMRLSIMEYGYTVSDGRFFVERVYGDHARIVYDIPLEQILAVGEKDEVFREYGNGQPFDAAVMKHNNLAEKAVAYRKPGDEQARLLVFQPNEDILRALRDGAQNE